MFVSQAETNVFRKRLFCGQKLTFPGYIYIAMSIYMYTYICIYVCI